MIKYLFIFVIFCSLLIISCPYLFFVQASSNQLENLISLEEHETQNLPKAPATFEEAKSLGKKILINFPEAFKKSWQEGMVIWNKIFKWFRHIWDSYIAVWMQKPWDWVKDFWEKEIEKKKPEIKEEFEKEKQEMKESVPKVGKSIWQRFIELVK